jgi:hypothetical protein
MTLIDLVNSPHLPGLRLVNEAMASGRDQFGRSMAKRDRHKIRANYAGQPAGDGDDDDDDSSDDDDSDDDDDSSDDDSQNRNGRRRRRQQQRNNGNGSDDDDDESDDDDEESDADKAKRLERELAAERKRRERAERRNKRGGRQQRQQGQQQDDEAEQKVAQATQRGDRLANRLVAQERDTVIRRVASRLNFRDSDDVVDYLTARPGRLPADVAELIEEDGQDIDIDVDETAIEKAVKELAKKRKHWLKEPGAAQSREAGRGDGERTRRRGGGNGSGIADDEFNPRGRLDRAYAGSTRT